MTRKLNCWEFRNCGREKGGLMVDILGECPAATSMKYDGHNDGVAAGRACWMVPRTGCRLYGAGSRSVQCHNCDFYRRVVFEQAEGACFKFSSAES